MYELFTENFLFFKNTNYFFMLLDFVGLLLINYDFLMSLKLWVQIPPTHWTHYNTF